MHDLGKVKSGIVSFTVNQVEPAKIKQHFTAHGINISISPANSTLLDMQERNLPEVVRASVHYYNTEEEIKKFIKTLSELIK